jgi:uncharacterized protein (DUF433 family)
MTLEPLTVPLLKDASGVMRVGGTRVTLETLLRSWNQGASAEEIVVQFPVLKLADVHAVLAHALRHPAEMDAYLKTVEAEEALVRAEVEARFPAEGLRARLLARRPA